MNTKWTGIFVSFALLAFADVRALDGQGPVADNPQPTPKPARNDTEPAIKGDNQIPLPATNGSFRLDEEFFHIHAGSWFETRMAWDKIVHYGPFTRNTEGTLSLTFRETESMVHEVVVGKKIGFVSWYLLGEDCAVRFDLDCLHQITFIGIDYCFYGGSTCSLGIDPLTWQWHWEVDLRVLN